MSKNFPRNINIVISDEMKIEIIAISFQIGQKGMYSRSIKKLLRDGVDRYKDGLTPKQKAEFEEIVGNVRLMSSMGTLYKGRGGVKRAHVHPLKMPSIEKDGMKL